MKNLLSKLYSKFVLLASLIVLLASFIYLSRDINPSQGKVQQKMDLSKILNK